MSQEKHTLRLADRLPDAAVHPAVTSTNPLIGG
jgi:hypothetical protein